MKRHILLFTLTLLTFLSSTYVLAQAIVGGENVDVSTERHAPKAVNINKLDTLPSYSTTKIRRSAA